MSGLSLGELRPDLTLILDLPVEDGLRRAAARRGGATRYENMDQSFHERLRQGFLDIARREPGRCALVDATVEIEGVQAALKAAVAERLGVLVP